MEAATDSFDLDLNRSQLWGNLLCEQLGYCEDDRSSLQMRERGEGEGEEGSSERALSGAKF